MRHPALEYFRLDRPGSPNLWCPGCGIGQVWYYTVQAINELGLDHDKVVWVGGSGCSGRMCTYWYKDSMHTLHGRPLGFATGIKLANPELTVICHMGDGETSAIGGNHLIQTARRNVELTAICINNFNYGMTGGQYSPTTPLGGITMTSVEGSMEPPFDLCRLVEACGAGYVARWTSAHHRQIVNSIKEAIQKQAFAYVEVVSQCPTYFGRRNRLGDGAEMMRGFLKNSVTKERAQGMTEEALRGKYVIGKLVDRNVKGYSATLHEFAARHSSGV